MPVVGQQGIRSLAIGEGHICDIDTVGTVWCWGSNDTGQLGIGVMGDIGNFAHPNEVDAAVDSIAMELGADHSCALLETAELNCWGHNQHGQLGNSFAGDIADSVVPNFVIGMQNVTAFGAGGDTSCAVSNGIVSCWGDNQYGQLGTATVGVGDFRVSATPVEGIDAVADIAVGTHHVCALRSDQSVWCWGRNNVHQIDASAAEMVIQPRRIELTTPIVQINAAADHTCALDTAGAVWCWGNNQSGQLSVIGEAIRTVQPVKDIPPMQVLATGQQHSCALSTSGTVWCWGSNEHGQMGVSRSETRTNLPPTEIPQFSGMTALFAGANRTCALDPAGVVWCWGENTAGTMGISPNPDRFTPAVVSKLWSMRMSPLAPRERTPLPVLPTLVPSATAVPTRTTVPTRTLVRLPTRVP
jgi:alpha-tubulin suppressor-like RCC1 family protein